MGGRRGRGKRWPGRRRHGPAETPRSGGGTTVRRGQHGPVETPRFGGDATVPAETPRSAVTPRFGGDTTVRGTEAEGTGD